MKRVEWSAAWDDKLSLTKFKFDTEQSLQDKGHYNAK